MKKGYLLTALAIMLLLNGCGQEEASKSEPIPTATEVIREDGEHYTFREAVSLLSGNWNPHVCETEDENYPNQFLLPGLYRFYFNDSLHPLEGTAPFEGYVLLPEMASAFPEDITAAARKKYSQFLIPEGKTSGYAFRIALNPSCTWENGKPIDANTYVESTLRLLDPAMQNPRAADMYFGEFHLAGAENYVNQGSSAALSLSALDLHHGSVGTEALLELYGEQDGLINWETSFGIRYDFDQFPWEPGKKIDPRGFCLEAENSIYYSGLTVRQLLEFTREASLLQDCPEKEAEAQARSMTLAEYFYPETVEPSQVGLIAEDPYSLILVFEKQISPFALCDVLTDSWLVEPNLYDACLENGPEGLRSCYGTSLDTTLSCGPYRMTGFRPGESMTFERNESWYGYRDNTHRFTDPADGKQYPMYETDRIETLALESADRQKELFLRGELSVYGMQPEDYGSYRNSQYCYADPSEVTLNLIFCADPEAMARREQAPGFDRSREDLQTMTLLPFREGISRSIDREAFAARINPNWQGAYGLISPSYISSRETGERYRDTEQGQSVLCELYGADPQKFGGDLSLAAASVTGYDADRAGEAFTEAFALALQKGYVTDEDGDGICDQTVTLELCVNLESPMKRAIADLLTEKVGAAARGTPFENRIAFTVSQPYGNGWYEVFAQGKSDMVLAGWSGSVLNPYSLTELYTDGINQYDLGWFDADGVPLTLKLQTSGGGKEVTLSLRQWSQALNGSSVRDGEGYLCQFGEMTASEQQRLEILSAIESRILKQYHYIPLLRSGETHLLSMQARYPAESFHPVMGHGDLSYLRYRYTDDQWTDYLEKQQKDLPY